MSRRKQAKPRSLKPDEELWSETNETKNVTEEALKSGNSDGDEATKDSNMEEKNKMAEEEEQNMADTNVKDAEDTESLRKSTERQGVEDVAVFESVPVGSQVARPQRLELSHSGEARGETRGVAAGVRGVRGAGCGDEEAHIRHRPSSH
ncbi:unnamed protein product [Danaus chrysippus]|uniref:(African queen) hypothetical protein n=1 Tax=Danaus chrysippus TaxID=151541 RepID=A0A8J2R884_9NEOP|nr:unnamed protein product [Danaus chrysippus]